MLRSSVTIEGDLEGFACWPLDSVVGLEDDVVLCRVYSLADVPVHFLKLLQTYKHSQYLNFS